MANETILEEHICGKMIYGLVECDLIVRDVIQPYSINMYKIIAKRIKKLSNQQDIPDKSERTIENENIVLKAIPDEDGSI